VCEIAESASLWKNRPGWKGTVLWLWQDEVVGVLSHPNLTNRLKAYSTTSWAQTFGLCVSEP
jgi:hypothetical protein